MPPKKPIDPKVRLAIATWPPDAPRGAVTTFCVEHGISREQFYVIRRRAENEGQAAALEPKSRRPHTSPKKLTDDVKAQAVQVRASLEASGLDCGPISVHDKMKAMGLPLVPSIAALARIFREAGVARKEPRKKPRASWRRFVYPAPNACWQLDATGYVISGGRDCTIFQLVDDHSRLALASWVDWTENADAAIAIFDKAVAVWGVPQRLLTDNHLALNPSRRGFAGKLVKHVQRLGVEAITSRPNHPQTQGKNERLHQTVFRWLDKQPLAENLPELLTQLETFDVIYNNDRPHQALPGRITPMQAYLATPKAEPPRPIPIPKQVVDKPAAPRPAPTPSKERIAVVRGNGTIKSRGVRYQVSSTAAGQRVYVIEEGDKITITDLEGEIIIEHKRPAGGVTYVGNGQPRGRRKGATMHESSVSNTMHEPAGSKVVTAQKNGQVFLLSCLFYLGRPYVGTEVRAIWDEDNIGFFTLNDEFITSYPKPNTARRYYGPRNPNGIDLKN